MGRDHESGSAHRGAHRAEPERSGPLATAGHVLGSTVPKRVEPPRLLSVLLISGVALGLLLFAYSTTQIYLRFGEPPANQGAQPQPGSSPDLQPSDDISDQETSPDDTGGGATSQSGDEGSPAGPGTVAYQTVESSGTSFTGRVTITNTSESPLEDWELTLGFSDARVTSAWDVDWESTGDGLTARQPESAAPLAPGESTTVNFTAEGSAQVPADCALSGHTCTL
ncbi:hypothetical protein F4561_004395 [Lipingzhangella halophila]|uniref:CBM2 domain-containing protein n=1 Tax=Lipingzhangella halophila TaxID=1783352 RepID=A0A7W7RKF3_9ACTN|nr:cellulose binding domain-containing protein [Lipingzhangella halophila]MBB4933575.1 hypothetical protein [Lipingzhangella halophila]